MYVEKWMVDWLLRIAASIGGKISSPFWNSSTALPLTTHSPAVPCSARRKASSSRPYLTYVMSRDERYLGDLFVFPIREFAALISRAPLSGGKHKGDRKSVV